VSAHVDDIADGLADQGAREGRDVGQRSLARLGLVFADNAKGLTAPVVARNRDTIAECDEIGRGRCGPNLGAAQPFGEIARFAKRQFDSALWSSSRCAAAKATRLSAIAFSSARKPVSVTRLGCGEIGRSGSETSCAVWALSSRVNATLMDRKRSFLYEIYADPHLAGNEGFSAARSISPARSGSVRWMASASALRER
jgi:hypothetical protein